MIIYSAMVNRQEIKMKMNKKIYSSSASGNATGISAFQIIKNLYPLPLKGNHQIFPNLTACQFFLSESVSFGDSLTSKLLYGNLGGYAGINIIGHHHQMK